MGGGWGKPWASPKISPNHTISIMYVTSRNPIEFGSTLLGDIEPTDTFMFLPSVDEREKLDCMLVGTTLAIL